MRDVMKAMVGYASHRKDKLSASEWLKAKERFKCSEELKIEYRQLAGGYDARTKDTEENFR